VDEGDIGVRNRTYARFAALGRAPAPEEVGPREEVLAAWRRLHDAHALVLEADGRSIRMANPFSAVPTSYRVEAAGRWWYANCAWDAFGICAALNVDGRIESFCPDCGEPFGIAVRDGRADRDDLVFHTLVSARRWWDDIVFT
jgi:hypothetical protein